MRLLQRPDDGARAADAEGDGLRAEAGLVRAQDAAAEAGQATAWRDDRKTAALHRRHEGTTRGGRVPTSGLQTGQLWIEPKHNIISSRSLPKMQIPRVISPLLNFLPADSPHARRE